MINNISIDAILTFAVGIVAVSLYFYFKKTEPLMDHVLLLVCGVLMFLVSIVFQFFVDLDVY